MQFNNIFSLDFGIAELLKHDIASNTMPTRPGTLKDMSRDTRGNSFTRASRVETMAPMTNADESPTNRLTLF